MPGKFFDMSKYDSKYEEAGDEAAQSHVRGIIQQLNKEKPSKEKSREVVVRPDGTKVIRVTKKRRVLVSDHEKRKAGRRTFLLMLAGGFVVCFALIGLMLFRMSLMTGEAYVQQQAEVLKKAWSAESISVTGAGVEGLTFHLTGVVAEFPEGSHIRRVALSDVSADLSTTTFFTNVLTADKLHIARAEVLLDDQARELHIPRYQGKDLWSFTRVECDDFQVSCGEGDSAVFRMDNAHSYLYYPRQHDRTACALVINGGDLHIRGMQHIRVKEAKFYISPLGIEDFSVNGTTDRAVMAPGQEKTSLSIAGRVPEGASLAGPFELDADNMRFEDFTQGRFENIFTARTVKQAIGREHSAAQVLLPFEVSAPVFSGEFALKGICLKGFPVQSLLLNHMESMKRKDYLAPIVSQGHVRLSAEGQNLTLTLPEDQVVERDLIRLQGRVSLNADNAISGNMEFGLPSIVTHAEYADGKSDPIFREEAGVAWIAVALSGTVNLPEDDSARLDAEVAAARSERPGRLQLDAIDFNKVADQMRRERAALEAAESGKPLPDASAPDAAERTVPEPPAPRGRSLDDFDSPLDAKGIFD